MPWGRQSISAASSQPLPGVELVGNPGQPYPEQTFRHLLANERARARRRGRTVRLLLVSVRAVGGKPRPFEVAAATRVFAVLSMATRETDFVGWYRAGRIAAAVMSERTGSLGRDALLGIRNRVADALRQGLPADLADALRLRVVDVTSGANRT